MLFLNYFRALLLDEIGKSCGTRPWSASGGRGTLSYHALDDRHEGDVKPSAMEAVRFGRVVPALLVSTLLLRSAPRAFADRDQRGDPCVLRSADRNRRTVRSVSTEPQRTCPSCGNEFSGGMEFCPVCILRKALAGGVESGESSSGDTLKPTPDQPPKRFEHYELVTGEDGKPLELGRGAMGVTYKAFDVDLHCPVTLKVISERYLGDESARLRFLREARAAASVRHPNVASVFHLGRTDENNAMEFV